MEQILLHLLGDYVLQTHWMAVNKVRSWMIASIHALIYSLPFLLIGSFQAWFVIATTHIVIDRFSLAKYAIWFKNILWNPRNYYTLEEACGNFGSYATVPAYVSFWLYAAFDNTIHLFINYFALQYL